MKKVYLLLSFLLLAPIVSAEVFVISGENNLVQFESTAKLEFIKGETADIHGFFDLSLESTPALQGGIVEVDLTTLKTGIDLRDQHMYERHLHVDKYPKAYFELTGVDNLPERLNNGVEYTTTASGWFYLHGVKQAIAPQLTFTFNERDSLMSVAADFELNLEDYEIPRPKALFLKLAETIRIHISFEAVLNDPVPEMKIPEWTEKK